MRIFNPILAAAVAMTLAAGTANAAMKNEAELNFGTTHPGTVTGTQVYGDEQRVDLRQAPRMIPGSMRPGVSEPSAAWGPNFGRSAQAWTPMASREGFSAMRGSPSK